MGTGEMNKRVAIIAPLGAHGSAHHFYLFGQLSGLKNNNVDVRIYTNSDTDDPDINGVQFYQFFGNLFSSRFRFIKGIKYVFGVIKSVLHARFSGVKLFHFHIFYINILVVFNFLLVRLLFGRIVLTVHDVSSFETEGDSSSFIAWTYKLADLILTHNNFSREEIISISPYLKNRIMIIPHGNYTPFINIRKDQKRSREYLGLPSDKTILLFFGMIKKVKGLEVLLRSFKRVVDENPNTVLLIAGNLWKNDFTTYQQIIDKDNLTGNIILHTRFIAHNDVEHYYCASDLVVLPYKKIYQSGVLMMTLSYSRPALVSDLPPLKEIISDNKSGFVFISEDIHDLAKKLNFILSDKETLDRVGRNGNRLINEKFCWDEIGRLTKKAYQTL